MPGLPHPALHGMRLQAARQDVTMALTQERLRQEFARPPRSWPLHPDAGPWCDCCLHIIRAGGDQPRHVPAAYMWVFRHGGKVPLCVSCCAIWRQNAAEDPELLPQRIYSL